jgi:hypothetical protein
LLIEKTLKKESNMKTQILRLSSSLFAIGLALAITTESRAALSLVNANFQDLTGLSPSPGAPGWYNGVPSGWSSSTTALSYNVINWNSGNLAANIQTLGPASPFAPLYQSAGLLDSTGKVTLTFNILGFSGTYGMAAGIYSANSDGSPITLFNFLASASYTEASGSLQTLEALNVAAGTRVGVAFWSWAGSPGVDNVNLVPEPSALSLLMMGSVLTLVVSARRRLQN